MLTKKFIAAALALGAFTFAPKFYHSPLIQVAQAEVKTYTGVGKCVQGDLITIAQAKNYACLRAEINAKEQAGVYLRGYTKMQNFNLAENEIVAITNNITNIIGDVQYKTETAMLGDSPVVRYIATLQANIDTDGINAYIQRDEKDKVNIVQQTESAQRELKNNLNKIDTLNDQYNKANSQVEKDKIRTEFNHADKNILAAQKNAEGLKFYYQGKYQEAINLYNEALQLNQNLTEAYFNLGIIYSDMQNYHLALKNFNIALNSNLNHPNAYAYRGAALAFNGYYYQATNDFDKAWQLIDKDKILTYLEIAEIESWNKKKEDVDFWLKTKNIIKKIDLKDLADDSDNVDLVTNWNSKGFILVNDLLEGKLYQYSIDSKEDCANLLLNYNVKGFCFLLIDSSKVLTGIEEWIRSIDYYNTLKRYAKIDFQPMRLKFYLVRKEDFVKFFNQDGLKVIKKFINLNQCVILMCQEDYFPINVDDVYGNVNFDKNTADTDEHSKKIIQEKILLWHQADVYSANKDYVTAIELYTKIIKLDSNDKLIYKARGECYKLSGETEKARADFAKAKELEQKNNN